MMRSGLLLFVRYYGIGCFIRKNTYKGDISILLSLNLYTYVHNNPLIYADPSGDYDLKFGAAYRIDSLPDGLKIIQRETGPNFLRLYLHTRCFRPTPNITRSSYCFTSKVGGRT